LAAATLSGCILVSAHETPDTPMAAAAPAPPPPVAVVAPTPPPAPLAPAVRERIESVSAPTYVSIPMEIDVKKPAKEVWARIGKYCDIAEWLQIAAGCKMTSGVEGDVGSVRSVGSEILIGKTELSYSYTQPVRDGRPYNLYHGTLEARPVTAKTSKIVYTLMYDNSLVPGDAAAKQAEVDRRRTTFMRGLTNMKILAEGGKLPPAPAPATPAPAPAPKPQ
jgi:hypothetical protein